MAWSLTLGGGLLDGVDVGAVGVGSIVFCGRGQLEIMAHACSVEGEKIVLVLGLASAFHSQWCLVQWRDKPNVLRGIIRGREFNGS